MDRQQIGMMLALDALGLPLRVDTFSDRLILQKAIYLAQTSGVHLGYHFRWYLRGPYSPDLTRDAFGAVLDAKQAAEERKGWSLDDTSRERLERLRLALRRGDAEPDADHLECLASVHFLVAEREVAQHNTEKLKQTLHNFGKDFDEEQIGDALQELEVNELLPRGTQA